MQSNADGGVRHGGTGEHANAAALGPIDGWNGMCRPMRPMGGSLAIEGAPHSVASTGGRRPEGSANGRGVCLAGAVRDIPRHVGSSGSAVPSGTEIFGGLRLEPRDASAFFVQCERDLGSNAFWRGLRLVVCDLHEEASHCGMGILHVAVRIALAINVSRGRSKSAARVSLSGF